MFQLDVECGRPSNISTPRTLMEPIPEQGDNSKLKLRIRKRSVSAHDRKGGELI